TKLTAMAEGEELQPSSERPSRRPARYFCTAGRGMEAFLLREVQSRLGATEVSAISLMLLASDGFGSISDSARCGKLFVVPPTQVSLTTDLYFSFQEMGRIIGITLMKRFGWKADLRNPDVEIFVHLNDIYCIIGIPVFRLPLANRAYIQTAGLRSTIAWAMASLAEIKNVNYLGTDISDSQLQGAHTNIKAANLMDKIQLLKASVTALPLPSESIDVVLADIPFGKKFKITKDVKLLPNVFRELERVLCAGGTVVLLLSQELYKCLSCGITSGPESENHISVEVASNCTQNAMVSTKSNAKEENVSHKTVSPSAQHERKEHVANKRTALGSLVLVESFQVSLGKTDAFICKYKKPVASPTRR
ncbi:hypothetical protein JD844_025522, partial [Phrynosoma platyrhinos]